MRNPSHPHSLTIAKHSSPANASATTNIVETGCLPFRFACVGIDPKAKPEGSWFCELSAGNGPEWWEEGWGRGPKGTGSNRCRGRPAIPMCPVGRHLEYLVRYSVTDTHHYVLISSVLLGIFDCPATLRPFNQGRPLKTQHGEYLIPFSCL